MSSEENIRLRDTRDRLSEMLTLGEPYPLRDLPVPAVALTVPFRQAAKVPVDFSQLGVSYQLHDPRNKPVTRPGEEGDILVQADGTGEQIHLQTPPIEDDVTYRIIATKVGSSRQAYLHSTATVKVGLDTSLSAWIQDHPALDPTADSLLPDDPRLCDYGDRFEVELADSQEGVDYRLVTLVKLDRQPDEEVVLSLADVRGTGANIVIQGREMMEDTTIRVRATKTFEAGEGRKDQTELLDIELPLKVKANRDLSITVAPAAIVDFATQTALHIAASQTSAQYRVFVHPIRDAEFVHRIGDNDYAHHPSDSGLIHAPVDAADVLRVRLPNEPEVQVRRPPPTDSWPADGQPLAGYAPTSDFQAGNGGELVIDIGPITADSLLVVEAMKVHSIPAGGSYPSSVWLSEVDVVLSRPDPAPGLELSMLMQGTVSDGRLRVEAGQPGVFYYLRTGRSAELPLPAYFHQQDDDDRQLNKGLGQLEVGIDLVVATNYPSGFSPDIGETNAGLAFQVPAAPVLESGPLAVGKTLNGRAVRAQTRIEAALTKGVKITALPETRLTQAGVDAGGVATVEVLSSVTGDHYQLTLDGEAVKPAQQGDGSKLSFDTGPVSADSRFELWVSRPDDTGLILKRGVSLSVLILPDSMLAVSATLTTVPPNGTTEILVEASQISASYQLFISGSPTGEVIAGNGAQLWLPTDPLTADSIIEVRASRLEDAAVSVMLAQTVTVTVVEPEPPEQ